jgi:hypothetical protein
MSKILSKSGISTLQIVRPWHVTQSIDAFTGTNAYDITLSGSMDITGSVAINGLSSTIQSNIITYNTSSGQLGFTASSAIGGGGGSTSAAGNNYEIQFNSASAFQATSSFKFNYLSQSLEQGTSVVASGNSSHAEGSGTQALGISSHAEGFTTLASGIADHAEGYQTTASSVGWPAGGGAAAAAHAEGYNTIAYGIASHAEGYATLVSASFSHAEGYGTTANGSASHAEGFSTTASGDYSHAAGYGTHATGSGVGQSIIGWFNEPVTGRGDFIIGNGTSNSSRSNLLHASGSLVTVTGNISSSGTVTMLTASIGGGIFTSASLASGGSTPTLQQVTDQGSSTTTPITASIISSSGNITALDLNLFGGDIDLKNGGSPSNIKLYCESSNAHYTQLQAASHSAYSGNILTILPAYSFDFATPNFQANVTASSFGGDGSALTNLQRPITSSAINFSASVSNAGYYIRTGGNVTCSIGTTSATSIPLGSEFEFFQTASAGYLLFTTSSGVTLNSKGGKTKLAGQFSGATLKKIGTDAYDLIGDLG